MSERSTAAHFLHDAGLAVWFGGSLMGAVGVNGAAAQIHDPVERNRAASAGWARWTPVNAAAIGAHLLGGALLLRDNKGRVRRQKGVLANTNVKLALTGAALGTTAYARALGQKVIAEETPVADGTTPLPSTSPEVAKAQKQLQALQWLIPGLTGAILVSSSLHEEQQRPSQVLRGSVRKGLRRGRSRAVDVAGPLAALASAREAAAPALVSARDHAVPAFERARDAALPAAAAALAAAGPALTRARDAAIPVAQSAYATARDTALPAAQSAFQTARETAVPAVKDAAERVRDALPA
jgi:hypothetical protein